MQCFFKTKMIADRIWSIDGPANTLMYLVEGDHMSMLVDTGLGIGNLHEEVKKLTQLPIIVVNTHGHPDHAGGNSNFSEIWFPARDLAIMKTSCTDDYRMNYIKAFHDEDSLDFQQYLSGLIPHKDFIIKSITNGKVFDLGGRRFEVVEIPGHTPGCVGFLNSEEKILFSGDSIMQIPVWLYLKNSMPFCSYLESIRNMKNRENEFEVIFPGHNPTPLGKDIFDQLVECAEEIYRNRGIGEMTKTFFGEGLLWASSSASIIYDSENWE